jgi:hypothetical protein
VFASGCRLRTTGGGRGAPSGRGRLRGDDGAALFEFALALPLVATLVLGIVDLGRVWSFKNRLTNAAREGAAVAQYTPGFVRSGCNGIRNVTDAALGEDERLSTLPDVAVTVRDPATGTTLSGCTLGALPSGSQVEVVVSAEFVILAPAIAVMSGGSLTITGYAHVVVQ